MSSDFFNWPAMMPRSFSLMFSRAWDSFIPLPVYLQGPPVASQMSCDTGNFRYGVGDRLRAASMAGFLLSLLSTTR